MDDPIGMTQERSRQLGKALMALAVLQSLWYFAGATRRSYLVVAIPVGIAVGIASGVMLWIGYTMATQDWDNPADYPPVDPVAETNEGAPPPEVVG